MIIYPPLIADTIPAFASDAIIIPFTQNPAVSKDQVTGFKLIIKDYQKSTVLATAEAEASEEMFKTGKVTFTSATNNKNEEWTPLVSQYYKFQLAYTDGSETELAYSTASVGRCIAENSEQLSVKVLDMDNANSKVEYTGEYQRPIVSEPLYSYCFTITDNLQTVIATTGEVIWNSEKDSKEAGIYVSRPTFKPEVEMEYGIVYTLTFSITTINGYYTAKTYNFTKAGGYDSYFTGKVIPLVNSERGCIEITFSGDPMHGHFLLERSSDCKHWDELVQFTMAGQPLSNFKYVDYSIEQGVKYVYALTQYTNQDNSKLYSNRVLSEEITADFEDMFLCDKDRNLKIKFNPKVSSFKDTILEQKTDTIGSQYPFFFRNGAVKYKEIPISGLISYHIDNIETFMPHTELGLDNDRYSTELTGENIAAERRFKLAVMEWLNNGQPKLFRSPTEGNYIVRLMSVSLSPNDTVARMLHSFSATGYEVAENNFNTMQKLGLVDIDNSAIEELDITLHSNITTGSYNNVQNIKWITNIPGIDESLVLDNNKFYNFTGIFETPKDTQYGTMEVHLDNGYGTVTFETFKTYEYDPNLDAFAQLAAQALEQVWLTADANTDLSDIKYIHYLTASNGGSIDDGVLTIDENNKIILVQGQQPIVVDNLGPAKIKLEGTASATMLVSKAVSK